MKRILLCLSLVAALAAPAQTTQKLTGSKANDYSLVYMLPNTVLDITLEAETTVKKPGEFYQYAKKYLNIADPVLKPSSTVVLKSVTVVPRGVANPDERYAVKFTSANPPFMIVGDQGMPLAINTERLVEVTEVTLPVPRAAEPTILESEAARHAVSADMLKSTSVAKRAEMAAELIYSIRESRNEIITGQAEQSFPDGRALQLALDNLTAQEEALTAMFTGTVQTSTQVYSTTFMPDDDVADEVIARLSPIEGFLPPGDLAGDPVYLNVTVEDNGEAPLDDKGAPLPFPKGGFAYAIPGKAKVEIAYDGKSRFSRSFDFAQFGLVYGLAPNLFSDKKAPIYAIFDPVTGAIRETGPVSADKQPAAAKSASAAEE